MIVATRVEAVVFDMDGVLLDSEPLHYEVVRDILAGEGVALSDEDYRAYLGTTLEYTWNDLIRRYGLRGARDVYHRRYDEAILASYRQRSTPAPGVPALIRRLREDRYKLAVASSSRTSWVNTALSALHLHDAFDTIVTGDMVTHSKPHPEIYLLAASRLGVAPERCIAIEDAPKGVTSARAAGMTVVGVRTSYTAHLALEGATIVLGDLTEFDHTLLA